MSEEPRCPIIAGLTLAVSFLCQAQRHFTVAATNTCLVAREGVTIAHRFFITKTQSNFLFDIKSGEQLDEDLGTVIINFGVTNTY